ncbi:MAG: hypothetical protein OXI39_06610 [Gemmatimonadota bacterium]|uniref:hypothetical protein n=1 Tax=Candidatus Palauibacter scopulicola TaxID=3056741 RepID=UPI00238907BA|nr:hypothetical protein [Candidatus Palauibacter scopulicola]MDE2662655.1 hypothetical protein [Candidatus Palauibacter scopulicola]
MRSYIVFLLLFSIKVAAKALCRVRLEWIREADDPWSGLRVLALLNHTSLFEPVFLAAVPNRMLWQLATHGVIPLADKTAARPILGRLFLLFAKHVVPVTREKDDTWEEVLRQVRDPEAVLIILPEGRMMRRTGLDVEGNPMTVRGGIADILRAMPDGRLFIAYSGGLHHIQAPGERFPRPFRSAWLGAEVVDIAEYCRELGGSECAETFKVAVIEDLTRRRDAYCYRNG